MGNPYSLAIPANPAFVGATLAFQGFTLTGGTCLGTFSLSDTLDISLR